MYLLNTDETLRLAELNHRRWVDTTLGIAIGDKEKVDPFSLVSGDIAVVIAAGMAVTLRVISYQLSNRGEVILHLKSYSDEISCEEIASKYSHTNYGKLLQKEPRDYIDSWSLSSSESIQKLSHPYFGDYIQPVFYRVKNSDLRKELHKSKKWKAAEAELANQLALLGSTTHTIAIAGSGLYFIGKVKEEQISDTYPHLKMKISLLNGKNSYLIFN